MKYIKTYELFAPEASKIEKVEDLEKLEARYRAEQVDGLTNIKLNDIISKTPTEQQPK